MTVKELMEELEKYSEDTQIIVEFNDDEFWLTYLREPSLNFKEEIRIDIDNDGMYYAWPFHCRWTIKNALVIK